MDLFIRMEWGMTHKISEMSLSTSTKDAFGSFSNTSILHLSYLQLTWTKFYARIKESLYIPSVSVIQ